MNARAFFKQSGMLVVFAFVALMASVVAPKFASGENMVSLGLQVSSIGIVACTMLFCLAAGDFDLSVGSTFALGGMVTAIVGNQTQNLWLGLLAGIAAGAVIGLLNGFVIAKLGINALITTLATMQIVRGLTNILGHGTVVSANAPGFDVFGRLAPLGMPLPSWVMAFMFILFGVLLNKTIFGRNTLAIGGNKEAAHLAGINVVKTKIAIFMLSGMAAAFAGGIAASRLVMASNNAGDKLELQAISACVLGGVSLAGGIGTISGALVGVLIMGIVENVMRLRGVDAFYQMVVTGCILLAAVLLDQARNKVFTKMR